MENNEQLALKKSLYSGRKTILFQFGTAVFSLLIGFGIIFLFTKWAGTWNARFLDNSLNDFLIDALMSTFGLIFLVGYITYQQFDKALPQNYIFRLSIKSGFYSGIVLACILTFFVFLLGATFKLLLLQFFFQITLLTLLGFLVGILQIGRLDFEDFHQAKHLWLLSNEADVNACKLNILPYRHQVTLSWQIMKSLIIVSFLGATLYIVWQDIWSLLIIAIIFLFITGTIKLTNLILNPHIMPIEGKVEKDVEYARWWVRYDRDKYKLICHNIEHKTDLKTWHTITAKKIYRLWVSGVNNHIFAAELIEKNTLPIFPPGEKVKKVEKKSNEANAFWLAGIGIAILSAFVWLIRRKS